MNKLRYNIYSLFYNIRGFYYKGIRYTCPICKGNFRKFLSLGDGQRKNVKCPGCSSFERHRLLWLYLKENTNLLNEKKNKRSAAALIYERLMDMPIISLEERKQLIEKVASLNSGLGKLKEAMRYEQMLKRPIEPPEYHKNKEDNVKKISFEDLGIQGL